MKNLYKILFMLFISINCFGQKIEDGPTCATDELLSQLIKNNPEVKERLNQLDNVANEESKNLNRSTSFPTVTIPVVVYVVHSNGPENISDAQVTSQITALNNYFNPYGIKFCLATKAGDNPLGIGIQTSPGILHHSNFNLTNHDAQTEQVALSSISTASPNNFLRIFVVKNISNSGTLSTTLGYSVLPGTSITFDGIVIRSDVFGDNTCSGCNFNLLAGYNQGKILVHEVGHYLGLYHTFHEGCAGMNPSNCNLQGDRVCDTPPVATPNFGCVTGTNSCHESSPDLPDSIHNYMDYGGDNCLNEFSTGQVQRMFSVLTYYKSNLTSTDNQIYTGTCGYRNLLSATFTANNFAPCANTPVTFDPITTGTGISYLWNFGDPSSGANNTSTLANPSHLFTSISNSPYLVTLTVTRGTESVISTAYITITNCQPISNADKNWLLSSSNILDFSTGTPTSNGSLPNGNSFHEACAFQNDANGNLLFYTNNVSVWNSSHTKINTTTPLFGNLSTKSGSLIIPNPANANQYYIFTKDAQDDLRGFRYNLVNVSNGVATMSSTINQPINFPSNLGYLAGNDGALYGGEGLAAIEKCNGYWIITSLKKSTGYFLIVYSLTTNGLAYQSEFQLPTTLQTNIPASVKISPNGNKLAYTNSSSGVYLFDFNKFEGTINNQKLVSSLGTYGICFSPDSNLLYTIDNASWIYQYNLNSNNIENSKTRVGKDSNPIGDIQQGPDNKLYINIMISKRLGVIHSPNNLITEANPNACFYTRNGPSVEKDLGFSLPNIITKSSGSYNNTITATPTDCFTYKFAPNVCSNNFSWNFGDPGSGSNNTSSQSNPTHAFSGYGNYTITLNAGTTTITYNLNISAINPVILGSTTACLATSRVTNNSVVLSPGQKALWSVSGGVISGLNNQSDVTVNWLSLPGTITLTVTNATGCSSTVTKTITSQCGGQPTCDANLTFNNTQTATAQHQASQTITTNTNYIVNNGIDIDLKAGQTVVISPNAHIKNGSVFLAHIGPCIQAKAQKQSDTKPVINTIDQVLIYPNPTPDFVNIELSDSLMTEITVNSIEGRLIHYKKTSNVNYYSLDLSPYEKGVYLLNLKTSTGKSITKKIVKQ